MRTVYVNEKLLGDREVVRGIIVANKTIKENIEMMFNKTLQRNIKYLMTTEKTKKEGGFHFFTKFCQFVVYFSYDDKDVVLPITGTVTKLGVSMEVMYFGTSDNPNDVFDYMLKLKESGWGEESRDDILKIAYQIKKDMYESHFEIAELEIKDHYSDTSLYF